MAMLTNSEEKKNKRTFFILVLMKFYLSGSHSRNRKEHHSTI
jgi:hypothetical protein